MIKRLFQCLGLASLILVVNYGDLLGGGSDVRMHTPFPLNRVCYAQIADILIVALFLFAVLTAVAHTGIYRWVRLLFAIVIPPYLIQRTQSFYPFDLIEGIVILILVVWAAIMLLLLLRFPKWYRGLMRAGSAMATALIVFAICSIAQLLWVTRWKPAPNHIEAAWNATAQPPRDHPLLVWIIFDELSHDQVFEHRAADLNLPNFDALRSQSTLFTDTQPAGYHTVQIIPSLLTGKTVDGIRYNFHNRLWVHHENESGWVPINGADTVFGDAQAAGWRTAAVGWYNPYCAIYSSAIQNCFWTNHDMFDGLMAQNAPFWTNVYTPLAQVVRERTATSAPSTSDTAIKPKLICNSTPSRSFIPTRRTSSSSTSPSHTVPTSGAAFTTTTPITATALISTTSRWSIVFSAALSPPFRPRRAGVTLPSSSKAITAGASMPGTGCPRGPRRTTPPRVESSTSAPRSLSTNPARASH
jgi:hypothetical protein